MENTAVDSEDIRGDVRVNIDEKYLELARIATRVRKNIVKMVYEAGSGHPGGSLSITDILTVLYFRVMRHDPKNPQWRERDRFVLSKGHAAPALYAVLAEAGYFPVDELMTLRKIGTRLQGHPAYGYLPGIEMSTGSLGQGLSAAIGMALAARLDGLDYTVYVALGDGEVQEGQIWEAAMAAANFRLNNIVGILDRNRLQIDGSTDEVMNIEPIKEKWEAFGWHVVEIDGHDYGEIENALKEGRDYKDGPFMIIANTVKGKGVSFMENNVHFHGKPPNDEEVEIALRELEEYEKSLGVE